MMTMIDVTRYLEHGDASVDRLRAEIERGLGGGIHMAVHATRGPRGVTVRVAALDGELDEAALEVVREAVRAHDPHAPDPAEAAQAEVVAEREADRELLVREAVADALSRLAVGIGQAEDDLAGIDTADIAALRAILRRTVNRQRLMLEFLRRLLRVVRWLAT